MQYPKLSKREIDQLNEQLDNLKKQTDKIRNEATQVIDSSINESGNLSCDIMTVMNIKNNIYKNICNEWIRYMPCTLRFKLRDTIFDNCYDNFILNDNDFVDDVIIKDSIRSVCCVINKQ